MSKQWGHGFHVGREEGIEKGMVYAEGDGEMFLGEHAWHSVCAAIEALESRDELRALMLLRTLKFALSTATGRDAPKFGGYGKAVTP